MEKRKWTDMKGIEPEIPAKLAAGKTRQEIADELGLTKVQVKNWVNRHNREAARQNAGAAPKRRGRPRKTELTTEAGYQQEIRRLKQENELLKYRSNVLHNDIFCCFMY